MINKIAINTCLLVALISSSSIYADSLIMCEGGRVKVGDSFKVVQKKCTHSFSASRGRRMISGKSVDFRIIKTTFSDGTKAAFIHINGKLIDVVVFD